MGIEGGGAVNMTMTAIQIAFLVLVFVFAGRLQPYSKPPAVRIASGVGIVWSVLLLLVQYAKYF